MLNKAFYLIVIAILSGCASRPPIEKPGSPSELPSRYLKLGGNDIFFVTNEGQANLKQAPIIYVHGLGGSHVDFVELIKINHPPQSTRPYYGFDLPLFGKSNSHDSEVSIQKYSELLKEIVSRLPDIKVNLVCHSMGGQICIHYALKHPERIGLLTLIAPAGVYNKGVYLNETFGRFGIDVPELLQPYINNPDLSWYDQKYVRDLLANSPKVLMGIDSFKTNLRSQVKKLKPRTLVIWGKGDEVFNSEDGEFLKKTIKNSTLHIIEEAGHVPMKSHAPLISQLIEKELESAIR